MEELDMNKGNRMAFRVMMGIYFLILIWVVLFHATLETLNTAFDSDFRSLNFYPYFNGGESLLNMLIFVPLGLYIEVLAEKKAIIKKALIILATTLAFETIQYIFAIGNTDIMDIINNSIGGFAGIAIGIVARKILKERFYRVALPVAVLCTVCMIAVIYFVPLR